MAKHKSYSQTEGETLPGHEEEDAFIDALPLVAVARAWNLSVATFNAEGGNRLQLQGLERRAFRYECVADTLVDRVYAGQPTLAPTDRGTHCADDDRVPHDYSPVT